MAIIKHRKRGGEMVIDWTEMFKNYKGLWVAIEDDKKTVIVSAPTNKEVLREARKKGYDKPFTMKIPKKIIGYAG